MSHILTPTLRSQLDQQINLSLAMVEFSLRSHSLGLYPFEIVEPHISTENHVQVAVPRILAVMACKGITRPLIPVQGVGY